MLNYDDLMMLLLGKQRMDSQNGEKYNDFSINIIISLTSSPNIK